MRGPDPVQADKMRALGRFAANVAHEFNNVLAGVLGQADLARASLAAGDPSRATEEIVALEAAALRGGRLVRQLLGFSRMQTLARTAVPVERLLEDASGFLRVLLPAEVELVVRAHTSRHILADRAMVEHMLMNLAANASDAMPGGGTLRLSAELREVSPESCEAKGWGTPGVYCAVRVEDTGRGIPPELLDRILEPFTTGRDGERTTGLGLAMVYGLMKQHEGWIDIESIPGAGTTVELLFPLASPEPEERPAHGESVGEGGGESILVVEDDETVRISIERSLRRSGYRVRSARDGAEALELLLLWPEAQLVLTDVRMPRMGGVELAGAMVDRGIELPVLFVTGMGGAEVRKVHGFPPGAEVLLKPWTTGELLARVRAVLDGHGEGTHGRRDSGGEEVPPQPEPRS